MPKRHPGLSAFFLRHVVAFNVLGLLLVVAGVGAYIVEINGSVTTGYALRDVQTRLDALASENQHLEIALRKSQSLEGVENSVKILGMVPAGTPAYVNGAPPSYALAK